MHRSKIMRDTTQLVQALTRRRTRSSLAAPEILLESDETAVKLEEDEDAGNSTNATITTISNDTDGTVKKRRRPTVSTKIAEVTETSPVKKFPRKAKREPAKRIKLSSSSEDATTVKMQPPANWEEMYTLTRQMRNARLAPVDTMGCESLALENEPPQVQRFQTLVALMLSPQTKDTVTAKAMQDLQNRQNLPDGLNVDSIIAVAPERLNELIGKVGFHNTKTVNIKKAAVILKQQYKGDIPETIEGLVALPGVGPKIAYLCMSAAWGRDLGIGVDVHVHRITNLWGWHPKQTANPEETRALLESWLPKDKWHDINNLLVGFGQTICTPVGRKCGECLLAERGLCPSAVLPKGSVKMVKKTKKEEGQDHTLTVKKEIKEEVIMDIEDVIPPLVSGPRTRRALRETT